MHLTQNSINMAYSFETVLFQFRFVVRTVQVSDVERTTVFYLRVSVGVRIAQVHADATEQRFPDAGVNRPSR